MITGRYHHGVVSVSDKEFCCIGGYDANIGALNQCEEYDIGKDEWKPLPSLNEKRYYHGCIYISKSKTIYCFGGYNGSWLNTMEKLDLNGEAAWKRIDFKSNQSAAGDSPMLYQVSSNEIVIFKGNGETASYLYNIKDSTIVTYNNNGNIKQTGDNHRGQLRYRYGNLLYSVGCSGHLHMFNPKERSCTSKPFSEIQ